MIRIYSLCFWSVCRSEQAGISRRESGGSKQVENERMFSRDATGALRCAVPNNGVLQDSKYQDAWRNDWTAHPSARQEGKRVLSTAEWQCVCGEGAAPRLAINTLPRARVYISDVGRGCGGGAGRLPWRRLSEGLLISPRLSQCPRRDRSCHVPPGPAVILSCHSSTDSSYCCLGTWPRPGRRRRRRHDPTSSVWTVPRLPHEEGNAHGGAAYPSIYTAPL